VPEDAEVAGLDLTEHSEVAYSFGGSESGEYVALSGGHAHGASSDASSRKALAPTRR
jgi:hypothetical protein